MNTVKILPSIMCCAAEKQRAYLQAFEASNMAAVHFDVMDGHYVPKVMLGVRDYQELKGVTKRPNDRHMMTDKPEEFVQIFQPQAGDWVSFHPETAANPYRLLQDIRSRNCRAGIALSPGVPVSWLLSLLPSYARALGSFRHCPTAHCFRIPNVCRSSRPYSVSSVRFWVSA